MGRRTSCIFFLLSLLSCCCWWIVIEGAEEYVMYKDPKQPLDARIDDLLKQMTLAEKVGQMTQIERKTATADVITNFFIGTILNGGGSAPAPQASAAAWIRMVNELQNAALSTRLGIPMIYGVDVVHGHNNVYNATIFPHNIGLGATRDAELVKRIGAATALEVRATGIPYVFAPSVAICRDPRWGRCYESFGEDPALVQQMTEIISGLQGDNPRNGIPFLAGRRNVAATAKHYVGDGGTYMGINENNTIISKDGLLSIHMPPYYDAIKKGVSSVMVSYSSWNGGFVISDWQGLDRITSPPHSKFPLSVELGILAGIDMVMVPEDYKEFTSDLKYQVEKNIIPMSRNDDAVGRILRVKFTMGLFEYPYGDFSLADELGKKEHREIAREAVRNSLVLLINGKPNNNSNNSTPVLPLPKKAKKILVAGTHADDLGSQCGGWTIAWGGFTGNNLTVGNLLHQSTQLIYSQNPDPDFVKRNEFSYAIVAVGEQSYAETQVDNLNLTIPDPGPRIIQNVCSSVKCVVISISGWPLVIEPYIGMIDAFVAAWLPGTEGQGVADVLFGDYGFSGKLPRTWFKSVNQLPMDVGDPHYDPLFPYGFGLTTKGA